MDTVSIQSPKHALNDKWNLYYHLPDDKNWDITSYTTILGDIEEAEQVTAINDLLPETVIRSCMLFLMRKGIAPMWEDPKNRVGGCFSYRILNKQVGDLWKTLMYLACGETLTSNPAHHKHINGITISPKKNFCIIKIWMNDCSNQNPAIVTNEIKEISPLGCLFKKHAPEY